MRRRSHNDATTRGERRERKRRRERWRMVIDGQATKTILAPLSQRGPPRKQKKRKRKH